MIRVLNDGRVELLDSSTNPMRSIYRAARICRGESPFGGTRKPIKDGDVERLVAQCLELEHNTPIEKAYFEFAVRCPIFVARQWMRHRMSSYNELSLRYNKAERAFYVPNMSPEVWEAYSAYRFPVSEKQDILSDHRILKAVMEADIQNYGDSSMLTTILSYEHQYNDYIAMVKNGVPKERARGVLGTGFYTEFIWGVNAWSLFHWMKQRLSFHAQNEHYLYANTVLDILAEKFPTLTKLFLSAIEKECRKEPVTTSRTETPELATDDEIRSTGLFKGIWGDK